MQLLRAALHHHLLPGLGPDGVAGPGVDGGAGDAAAGALLAVVAAGGFPGYGDLRVALISKFVSTVAICVMLSRSHCIWGLCRRAYQAPHG